MTSLSTLNPCVLELAATTARADADGARPGPVPELARRGGDTGATLIFFFSRPACGQSFNSNK